MTRTFNFDPHSRAKTSIFTMHNEILPNVEENYLSYTKLGPDESLSLKYKLQIICTLMLVFINH